MNMTPEHVVSAVGIAGAPVTAVVGAPLWTTVMLATGGLLLAFVHAVFPQESADKLDWWRDRRGLPRRRRRRR